MPSLLRCRNSQMMQREVSRREVWGISVGRLRPYLEAELLKLRTSSNKQEVSRREVWGFTVRPFCWKLRPYLEAELHKFENVTLGWTCRLRFTFAARCQFLLFASSSQREALFSGPIPNERDNYPTCIAPAYEYRSEMHRPAWMNSLLQVLL